MTSTTVPTPAAPSADASAPIPTQTPEPAPVHPVAEAATPEPAPSAPGALAAACAAGTVALYRVRASGTLRHIPFLVDGTPARMEAEWYAWQIADEGQPVRVVATAAGVSVATLRRALTALALTEAIEDQELDDLYAPDVEAIFVEGTTDYEDEA
jgi:hypothetical protein